MTVFCLAVQSAPRLVASAMKLNPQQAPLYGECLLTVQLCEEECVENEEDVEFYLLFAGTTQRHVSSTLKISHVTLQAVCPAHDCSETVRVTLCQARPGGSVDPVAEERFQFVQDLALDMAQFLVNTAGKSEGALLLDECQTPLKECERLDDTLALALKHLPLPPGWSVLGTDFPIETNLGMEPGPQDTLLHFAAKRGLRKVAIFLLQQPGGREALRLANKQGRTPARVAQKRGHKQLQKLLTEIQYFFTSSVGVLGVAMLIQSLKIGRSLKFAMFVFGRVENLPELETKTSKWRYPGGRVLLHHPKVNTYTLTLEDVPGSPPPNLRHDVEELQHLIRSHRKEDSPVQPMPALLILDRKTTHTTETVDCFNSLDSEHQEPSAEQETCKALPINFADGLCPFQNGTGDHGQSRDKEVKTDTPAVGDTGKASVKCAEWRAEADSVGFSAPSCGNQGEEADIELGLISAKQGVDKGNQEPEAYQRSSETDSSTQSGNLESLDMGHTQSQDHSSLPTETSQSLQREEGSLDVCCRGDLPEEKEGETNSSSQETASNSLALSSHDPEENVQRNDKFEPKLEAECSSENGEPSLISIQVNSDFNSLIQSNKSDVADPLGCPETGNLSEHTKGNSDSVSGLVEDDVSIKRNSGFSISEVDSPEPISLRPNMVQGPTHKGGRGLTPVPETLSLEGPSEEASDHSHASSSETTSECPETLLNNLECEIKSKGGGYDAIAKEAFLSEEMKEVTLKERPQDLEELIASSLKSVMDDIAVSELDNQSEPSDEASHLPVDSDAFITTDIQQGVSIVLSTEPSDVIIVTTLRDKEELKTNLELDSLSKEVEQILEEASGDDTNLNEIHKLSATGPELSALNIEQEEMKKHQEELVEEKEMVSTSRETISDLPDRLETAHVSDTECKAHIQLPDPSLEGVNTISDLTVCENEPVQGLIESAHNRPSQTDWVETSDVTSDGCIDMATFSNETAVTEDCADSSSDAVREVVLELENVSTSELHNPSSLTAELTSPLDISSELHQDLEHTSSVDTDNGLSTELRPSDTTESVSGLHQDNIKCLMEENKTVEQYAEEPHAIADGTLAKDAVDGHQGSSADVENSEVPPRFLSSYEGSGFPKGSAEQTLKDRFYLTFCRKSNFSARPVQTLQLSDAGKMYERHRRRYSLCAKGERAVDVVLIKIHRETETFFSVDSSRVAGVQETKTSSEFPPSTPSPESVRHTESANTMRGSASDGDSLLSQDLGEDSVFNNKSEDSITITSGISMSYSSSTDDTSSLGTPSTIPQSTETPGSNPFLPESPRASPIPGETEEEERKDRLTEVPERSAILRTSMRSLSPFRRHSWGPGKNSAGEVEISQRSTVRSEAERRSGGHRRSYSLEGLSADKEGRKSTIQPVQEPSCPSKPDREERGSLVSLTEEEQESDMGDGSRLASQKSIQSAQRFVTPPHPILTKSVSMLAISQKDLDAKGRPRPKRRISFSFSISPLLPKSKSVFSIGSSSSDDEDAVRLSSYTGTSGSLEYSISEEDPGPLRSDNESKAGGTKVSRTFSYLRNKMSKKNKKEEKEKSKERERDAKDKEKRASNGHLFTAVMTVPIIPCHQCNKPINTKDAFLCTTIPARDRPWSTLSFLDDQPAPLAPPRKGPGGIMSFNNIPLSKSMSINNIAGQMEDPPLRSLKFLSQSTDSLHKTSKVTESTESLTDEGTEMMDNHLMGEFEADVKDLEADSWSFMMDKKHLKQLKKEVVKRQDVIYELIQTEMHHVRTLKIMADVYSKGLQREVQLEVQTVEKMFPMLEDLLDLHTQFFTHLIEKKKEAASESKEEGRFVIRNIGDMLVSQFSGSNAERMKRVYGKFCSRHNEAVNFYKELHTKDKRFQAFIRKKMSSPVVRRLSIPECILLVTQRITKYPVLLQRILQHTKENEEDHADVTQGLKLVKEMIATVDNKVNDHEKKKRLKEVYLRTDSKSIMRMKSGQMFAREDLLRGQKLIHDGSLQLKNTAGRLKDVQALLLRDVIVFLQEKDQKYIFASLDQRSTVISLQKLILREVANEEKGLFLITAGIEKPEMVEVYASSKEERNTWMQLIQEVMQSMERDDDEGVPSENEEDRRLQEIRVKELKDQLHKRDEQILSLLEEKVKLFRDMCDCSVSDETGSILRSRMLFRAMPDDITKGEPIMKDALMEVETLQGLVNGCLGGTVQDGMCATGPVSLPRRAETFGGFDSHQMNISKIKDGDKHDAEDSTELRRTESDSVLKKASNTNPLLLLKRNNEPVLQSVAHLHDLLNTLQAVVVQQDTFIEDQRHALTERPQPSSRHPSISSSSSSSSSRPSSLIEQEKQRSLEKQRQEVASLQKQQAAHAEERKRREKEWEARERELTQRETQLLNHEEEALKRHKELEEEKQELQNKKEEYQRDLARLRDSQKKLERDREQIQRETEQMRQTEEQRKQRTPSTTSEDSSKFQSSGSLDRDPCEVELSSSPSAKDFLSRMESKRKGKNLNPFSSNSSQKAQNSEAIPSRLLQLAKPKEKKEKKKKKGKGHQNQTAEPQSTAAPDATPDGEIFFC
ncbi:A-kinase anchor protein 13 [Triplophysa tibetana]|uniref:A-kinase anchor protein 13 n=1 Tax=Triplophysa tibetana TaxID=1572043 RepID=A0A5A9PS41_9TELE|nr:A-kinase anchor protein 13 [Triplophysa tibetana]